MGVIYTLTLTHRNSPINSAELMCTTEDSSITVPNNKNNTILSVIYCLPCIIFIAVVILVVRAHLGVKLTYGEFWSFGNGYLWDLSAWYKSRLIVLATLCALCILLVRVFTKSFTVKKTILYIPMAVYTITVILSLVFSKYKKIAWSGATDRFEGTYILVCYMFMLFYTINTINTKHNLKLVVYAVIVSQLLLQIIGIAQFTGHNPFESVIGQKLTFPNHTVNNNTGNTMWQLIDELAKETPPRSIITSRNVYQTVYSFNYLSLYLCVIIPVFAMMFVLSPGIKQKIAMAVMFMLAFINICAANASGGFLGLFAACIAGIITFRKLIIKWRYQLLIIIFLAGVSVVLMNRYMKYTDRRTLSGELSNQIWGAVSTDDVKEKIDYFITNNDNIVVSVNDNRLKLKINNNAIHVIDNIIDSSGNQINLRFSNSMISSGGNTYRALAISFEDIRFANMEVYVPKLNGNPENYTMCIIKLKNEEKSWPFFVNQDGTFYLTDRGALVKLRKVPYWGFKNNMNFGTRRGYIWSRTFPLMVHTLFLGNGADTFAMYFPQDDFTGLYYDYGWHRDITPIIDKPHNFVLLTFVNTGGISALALLSIIFIYLIQSFGLYSKIAVYDIFSMLGAGIYLGIVAFLVAGMVYDTSVNVMPLIYGLLGIGISCNFCLREGLDTAKNTCK